MRTIFYLIIFFAMFKVFAEDQKLDLRERLQFTRNSKNEVTFEYCKLSSCEKLNSKPISQDKLSTATQKPVLSTGIANQLLIDAGSNSDIKMNIYGVAGVAIGDGNLTRANCTDQAIEVILNKAKKEKDFIFPYNVKECSRNDVSIPIKSEAEFLKAFIKSLIK